MQKSALTNRQAAIWVTGICFVSAAFMATWTALRERGFLMSSQDSKQISARERYIRQAKQWERNLTGAEVSIVEAEHEQVIVLLNCWMGKP